MEGVQGEAACRACGGRNTHSSTHHATALWKAHACTEGPRGVSLQGFSVRQHYALQTAHRFISLISTHVFSITLLTQDVSQCVKILPVTAEMGATCQ